MGRSKKKGPYVDLKVLEKVMKQKETGSRDAIKTWARACMIVPEFIGHNFAVHTGNKFTAIFVTEGMVGHKLGEFAITRNYHGHSK